MAQIEIKDLTFYYDDFYHPVFEHLNVNLDTDWKMALVGRNGRGKTTLLHLLEGSLEPSGGVIRRRGTVSYFPYTFDSRFSKTEDVVKECIGNLRTLELQLEQYEKEPSSCGEEAYFEALNRYAERDGYAMESRICKEVVQMGLQPELLEQDFATLSGGEQTCMLIIALFLRKEAFVLLDEPTNHLDKEKKEHLKEYLKKKKGYIIASHDTVFLDAVCDHILAINRVDISIEQGSYSSWRRNMELKEQFELRTRQRLMQEINQLEHRAKITREWSDVGNKQTYPFAGHFRTNGTRAYMRQAKAAEQQIHENLEAKKQLLRNMEEEKRFSIYQEVLEQECLLAAENISFCYEDTKKPVLDGVTVHIYPGDKIWVRGRNGAGKSTLLMLLSGRLPGIELQGLCVEQQDMQNEQRSGIGYVGRQKGKMTQRVSGIAYVEQEPGCHEGDISEFLQERLQAGGEEAFVYARFRELCSLFDLPEDFEQRPLHTLSCGERKKVHIAKVLAGNHRILFLDEPLNYMDVYFKAQLETALADNTLTIVFVEHNEEFGRRIANKVVALQ